MKKSITKLIVCCALVGGIAVPSTAQLQSKVNFTLEQHAQIEALAKEYVNQGLDIKRARKKAEKEVAPEVVKLRVGNNGYLPTGSVARPDLTPWPVDHAAWVAASTYPGSIEVDRDTFIHTFKPSDLVKKVLLKAYTPEDEARIQNVRFLGFNGLPGGGDDWQDNPLLTSFGAGNRGLTYFTKGTSSFAIPKGLLLSTGETWGHEGPNELTNAISEGVIEDGVNLGSVINTETYDTDLAYIAQQPVTYGGILEFDFCPAINQATFNYVFGSEEYPEFVHSTFNDVFGFFVSGPYETPNGTPTVGLPVATWEREMTTYNGEQVATYNSYNIAQLPNGMPVGVDWTNWGWRDAYDIGDDNTAAAWLLTPADTTGLAAALLVQPPAFPDNLHGSGSPIAFNPEYHRAVPDGDPMMELDGTTIKLTALMDSLIPGKWYRLKIGIAQVDWQHGDGVFIGNLDLGQATSGIGNNNGWANWPAANDLLGLTYFYGGCADTLTIDFEPKGFTQYVEIMPKGALSGNIVGMDGNPLSLKDSLLSNQSRIVRIFQVSEDASFESGAEGWFETYSYEFSVHGTPNEIPSNAFAGDTSAVFNLYKRFTSDAVFNRPTTGYAGRLDLNIKDGSPSLFRSVNGGITWENAYLPFSQYQLSNLAENENAFIMLKEPNSCWNATISLGEGIVPPGIQRPVWMPEVSNAILSSPVGINYITSRQHFVFTITPTGANAGMAPVITTDRTSIPDSEGVTVEPNGDGSYTVTIYRVQEPIRVSIDFATGNASIEDGNKIWSGNGQLYIKSATTCDATIYNVTGKLVNTVACLAGETVSTVLPSGFYIVTLSNGHSYKVSVK